MNNSNRFNSNAKQAVLPMLIQDYLDICDPVLTFDRFMDCSIICSPRYQRYTLDLAAEKGIPVQASVREGGGNNGAVINTSLDGIPVIVIGVPVRYIHSHYGITSYYDFEASVRLAVEVVRSMNAEVIDSF